MKLTNNQYDVIIAGAGMNGTILGSVLAKNGLQVLLTEAHEHPRFALGEALLPQSAMWAFILGEYYDLPEIAHLSHTDRIVENVTQECGLKKSIGFAYHQKHEPLNPQNCHQLIPPHLPFYQESHLMRSEVDHYLLKVAMNYGCDYVDHTQVQGCTTTESGVTLETSTGTYAGQYLVDASGRNSPLAGKFNQRTESCSLETNSRAIFAHVENLTPFDDFISDQDHPNQSKLLHEGTLHHVFDGGWLWVIPFNNFDRSTSTQASLGLVLDAKKYPKDDSISPKDEFWQILSAFPTIKESLSSLPKTQAFRRTDRLQYNASQSVRHRYFATSNTHGFVDPLYSNGVINSLESVFIGAELLLKAFANGGRDEDFAPAHFQPLETLHHTQIQQADQMISNAYRAMGSFETWSAWTQYWLGQVLFHDLWLQRACFRYFSSGQKTDFMHFHQESRPGTSAPFYSSKSQLLTQLTMILKAFEANEVSQEFAARKMLSCLSEANWLPSEIYGWGQEHARHVDFSNISLVQKLLDWGKNRAPTAIQDGLFDFQVPA